MRRYVERPIGEVQVGDRLDQGTFAALESTGFMGTVLVRLEDGLAYTEARGAKVRVWKS